MPTRPTKCVTAPFSFTMMRLSVCVPTPLAYTVSFSVIGLLSMLLFALMVLHPQVPFEMSSELSGTISSPSRPLLGKFT